MGYCAYYKRDLLDRKRPKPPYYLKATDLFFYVNGREIFLKKIYSISPTVRKRGTVIMAPGIATNANLYRLDVNGNCLSMDNNLSFANLLASEGFIVFLYHPGYTERVYNRYVCRHCKESIYYKKKYRVSSELTFFELASNEIPGVINYVQNHTGEDHISWIGYSLGGMLIYAYCMQSEDDCVNNIVTIGSPITFNQIFIRIIPYMNWASKALGYEEKSFLGTLSENLVPITRIIRNLPGWLVKYNILTPFLFNPVNITGQAVKAVLGKIVEPIPSSLEDCFAQFISKGFPSFQKHSFYYLNDLRNIRKVERNFLFFYGPYDFLAPPDSVFLAHEIISPNLPNIIKVPSAGHVDLIVGKNAKKDVWMPVVEWLKDKYEIQKMTGTYNPFTF